MTTAIIFEIPAREKGIVTASHGPLVVVTTSWTAEGHPGADSVVISYGVDLKAKHGLTDSGEASFRFAISIEEIADRVSKGEVIDLRGRAAPIAS